MIFDASVVGNYPLLLFGEKLQYVGPAEKWQRVQGSIRVDEFIEVRGGYRNYLNFVYNLKIPSSCLFPIHFGCLFLPGEAQQGHSSSDWKHLPFLYYQIDNTIFDVNFG